MKRTCRHALLGLSCPRTCTFVYTKLLSHNGYLRDDPDSASRFWGVAASLLGDVL